MSHIPKVEDPNEVRVEILETYGNLCEEVDLEGLECHIEIEPPVDVTQAQSRYLITPNRILILMSTNPEDIWDIPQITLRSLILFFESIPGDTIDSDLQNFIGTLKYSVIIVLFESLEGQNLKQVRYNLKSRVAQT